MRSRKTQKEIRLEPVLAYDRVAPDFARLSDRRRAYLDSIDRLVISEIPHGSRSLLDVGSGDGTRAARIAKVAGIQDLLLLEPSAAMRSKWPAGTCRWPIRAEQLSLHNGIFDVITCLWNVLGHIFPSESRIEVLRHCGRLLSPQGAIFIDVTNRYNALHFGFIPTLLRVLRDSAFPDQKNGDVIARWNVGGRTYATKGHVFTHAEFRRISSSAGLAIKKNFSVDYATGKIRRSQFAGNLLYVLQKA